MRADLPIQAAPCWPDVPTERAHSGGGAIQHLSADPGANLQNCNGKRLNSGRCYRALRMSSTRTFASPKSIELFSRKKSGFCTPA